MDVKSIIGAPLVRVKIVAVLHLILLSNSLMGAWIPVSIVFYNMVFMVTLFWAIHSPQSVDSILLAAITDGLSIIFDLILIIGFFSGFSGWSVVFAILNLIARPFTLLILHKEFTDRGGTLSPGTIFPAQSQRTTYEDMDRPSQSVPTNNPNAPPSVVTF